MTVKEWFRSWQKTWCVNDYGTLENEGSLDFESVFTEGFKCGQIEEREACAKAAWEAVRTAAERMDDANGCALMADFAESAIRARTALAAMRRKDENMKDAKLKGRKRSDPTNINPRRVRKVTHDIK